MAPRATERWNDGTSRWHPRHYDGTATARWGGTPARWGGTTAQQRHTDGTTAARLLGTVFGAVRWWHDDTYDGTTRRWHDGGTIMAPHDGMTTHGTATAAPAQQRHDGTTGTA